jgi:signal transduction histidine kinase
MNPPDADRWQGEQISILRKFTCLVACQASDDAEHQATAVLRCLMDTLGAEAAGIYRRHGDSLAPVVQLPPHFVLDQHIQQIANNPSRLEEVIGGEDGTTWLIVPMRATAVPVGRLWTVMPPNHVFSKTERELLILVGNQLAMAQENLRLYQEVKHLAERRGALLNRIINVQDGRCRRVSRELHDEVSQSLAALAIDLDTAAATNPAAAQALHPHLERLRAGLERVTDEVNRIVLDLRPSLLEDHGLVAALRWYGTEKLGSTGTQLHMICDSAVPRLPPHLETTVYRIGQESLTNVAHHAGAANVWLTITCNNDTFTLSVRDDGRGFDLERVLDHPQGLKGVGLFGMQERAGLVGGRLVVETALGAGTCVTVTLPVEVEKPDETYTGLAG